MATKSKTPKLATALAVLALAVAPLSAASLADNHLQHEQARVAEQVRKQIVKLPFYSIFDHIQLSVDGDVVTLQGAVYRPSLKKSAERVAARVEGVSEVRNQIEILPTSTFDDRIRIATARALFRNPVLDRYAIRAVPPIHIIVKNGDITLEGVVNREMERNVAGIVANGVSGAFSVTNNLRVENPRASADSKI